MLAQQLRLANDPNYMAKFNAIANRYGLEDCLESLALNVSTDFASKNVVLFCKSPPHSARSSLELLT